MTLRNTVAQRAFALDVPFSMRGVAIAAGAIWNTEHSVFMVAGDAMPRALESFRPLAYSYEADVQREFDAVHKKPLAFKTMARHTREAMLPRPHQQEATNQIVAAHAAGLPGFLLADDVGLGKTIAAWSAVLALPNVTRVLVVSPLAVLAHWRATIEAMGDNGKSIVVINYDRLGKLFEVSPKARKKIRSKKGLAKAGTAPEFDLIVWDESHRCKNPTAARSKLAAKLTAASEFCIWLSATAGQNPIELSYLAPLLASVTGHRAAELKDFEVWCQGQGLGLSRGAYGKWEWRGDIADCKKVRELLFDPREGKAPVGLRRRPEDIAGWPAINRMLTPIALEPNARELYTQLWTEFRKEMALLPRGGNPKGALAATLRLRQKSSLVRAEGTAELVRELLENGKQVAISVAFRESLDALKTHLNPIVCAQIHGGLSAAEREAERLRFQQGEASVVLFTLEEGISLHQGEHGETPRAEVVHDLRWSAIQMAQIEGRCHRDGRFAQVYWTYAEATIEERIARIVVSKLLAMKEMIGDDTRTMVEIEALLAEP
jgi:superfamily II DNA or RNA helicase